MFLRFVKSDSFERTDVNDDNDEVERPEGERPLGVRSGVVGGELASAAGALDRFFSRCVGKSCENLAGPRDAIAAIKKLQPERTPSPQPGPNGGPNGGPPPPHRPPHRPIAVVSDGGVPAKALMELLKPDLVRGSCAAAKG